MRVRTETLTPRKLGCTVVERNPKHNLFFLECYRAHRADHRPTGCSPHPPTAAPIPIPISMPQPPLLPMTPFFDVRFFLRWSGRSTAHLPFCHFASVAARCPQSHGSFIIVSAGFSSCSSKGQLPAYVSRFLASTLRAHRRLARRLSCACSGGAVRQLFSGNEVVGPDALLWQNRLRTTIGCISALHERRHLIGCFVIAYH